jgi:DNA ligase-1
MRRRSPQHFCAFDILRLDGNLRGLPFGETQAGIAPRRSNAAGTTLYADHFEDRGLDLFRVVCENDLEGIVAKRKDGQYTPEETSWVKIKNPRYSQAEGRHELFEKRAAGV